MYRVNINPTYFQNNLKRVKQPKESIKPKFLLTEQQKQYIELQLPRGYRLMVADIDEKRSRIPKKTDAEFETQFPKRMERNDKLEKKQSIESEKRIERKQERREKQKLQGSISHIKQAKSLKFEQQTPKMSKARQNKTKDENKNQENQIQRKIIQISTPDIKKQMSCSNKAEQKKQLKTPVQESKKQIIQLSSRKQSQQFEKIQQEAINFKSPSSKEDIPQLSINNSASNIPPKPNELTNDQKQFCLRLVNKLRSHKSSWPFRVPVDPITQGVPNYLQIIHEPMDLKSIQKKLNNNRYEHVSQIHGDINKIFLNSYKFNPKQTNYYTLTVELQAYYHELLKEIQTNPNLLEQDKLGRGTKFKIMIKNNEQDFTEESPTKKKKVLAASHGKEINNGTANHISSREMIPQQIQQNPIKLQKVASTKVKPKFTQLQKKQLVKKIHKISSKALENVVSVAFGQIEEERTTFYLDLEKLSDEALTRIENIVKNDMERSNEQSKNSLASMQARMSVV